MQCTHCGANVAATAKFCKNCGKLVIRAAINATQNICPSCRLINSTGAKYCKNCGTRLDTQSASLTEVSAPSYVCPNCGAALQKEPKRKIACPTCKKPIYVKSRPTDRKKVLVTQEQADEIEEEWTVFQEIKTLNDSDRERYWKIRAKMVDRDGKESQKKLHAALHDIRRGSSNKQALECIRTGNFGMWRNTRLDMAFLLKEEGKVRAALETFLEVCYVDLNGPQNNAALRAELGKKFPRFDPSDSLKAPGIIFETAALIKQLALTKNDVKTIFFEHNKKYVSGLRLPLSLDEAWLKLYPELSYETVA
jgi:DNA-directed RNA polymerase subunit RPC12/RpoP/phage FluMu protein Com